MVVAHSLQLIPGLSDSILTFIFTIALILGLLIAIAGKLLWRPFMSLVGGFIGSVAGFAIGFIFFGFIGGLIGAFIGGFIGSIIFGMLVELSVSILAGGIVLVLSIIFIGSNIIGIAIGAVLGIVVLIGTYMFIEQVIGVITAIVGSFIVGISLIELNFDIALAAVATIVLIIVGSIVQTFAIKRPSRAPSAGVCPKCGARQAFDQQHQRWYCPSCGWNQIG